MNKKSLYISVVALILSVVALGMCTICCNGKKTVEGGSDVEAVLMKDPEIIVRAMQSYENKMREEAMAQSGKLISDNIKEINENPNSPVMGNPNGKIVLVEFFDYACGYCHKLHGSIKNILAKNPDVKFVSKELAFVSSSSEYAARAAFAANEQGKYEKMHDALMEYNAGPLSEVIIDEIAQKVGLDMTKYKADINSEKSTRMFNGNNELAGKIQINGVPTIILNGTMLQTIDETVIQEAINALK